MSFVKALLKSSDEIYTKDKKLTYDEFIHKSTRKSSPIIPNNIINIIDEHFEYISNLHKDMIDIYKDKGFITDLKLQDVINLLSNNITLKENIIISNDETYDYEDCSNDENYI